MEKIGSWSFIIGLVIAVVIGVLGTATSTTINILLILGAVVGLLNVTDREVLPLLIATVALIVAGSVNVGLPGIITSIQKAVVVFVVPATLIASLKAIISIGISQ